MYNVLFLIGKIIFGGYFLMSGINHFIGEKELSKYAASKNIPFPKFSVILTGIVLVFGGLGIITGMYITFSATLIWLFLLVVSFTMHDFWNIKDPAQRANQKLLFSKNIALLGAALIIASSMGYSMIGGGFGFGHMMMW